MAVHVGRRAGTRRPQAGFTLIELMIVIAVLAILAAIAYPNYQDHVRKANRADAKSMLSQVASRQEQFFLNNKSYTTGRAAIWAADAGDADDDGNTTEFISEAGYYTLGVTSGPTGSIATSYALTAGTNGAPQSADSQCLNFTLDSRGTRGVSGSGTASECW